MMRWLGVILGTVVLMLGYGVRGADFEETQGFFDCEFYGEIDEEWSYFLNHESKIRERDPSYYLWHAKAGLRYRPTTWLCLALAHRYEDYRAEGEWCRESRTEFTVNPSLKLGKWTLRNRARIEYRDFESPKTDRWRYLNEVRVSRPLPWWKLKGFVAEEPHYDFEIDRWSKHRITVGVSRRLNAWLSACMYYRWDLCEQSRDPGNWDTYQIFGLKFTVDTDKLR